ncbi:uncharacterized protein LOC126375195 [Pectinophora gossypiella]|uniref:uncharacterized protein LOC126375195 n=1 Tax=Pectinophora gossypiella TaxID=13191 RepID=UPI00214E1F04|nr:uncharacterized protein LOC126375195 [Pectinophora gossypiella]
MRRGHPGAGGWRSDNSRHFRPRGGGTPHFRHPRGYGHSEGSRFPHPGGRHFSGPPPNIYNSPSKDHDHYRGNRHNSQHRMQDRGHQYSHGPPPRQIFPLVQRMRHNAPPDHSNTYQDMPNYYDNNKKTSHINSMGDVDDRQQVNVPQNRESYQRPSPWVNPPYYDDRSPSKSYKHSDTGEYNKSSQSTPINTGHRPPASDHYGSNHGSTMDNSNTFSRSIDDTVNIIRKRLLTRESQLTSDNSQPNQSDVDKSREPLASYPSAPQEQPTKRKPHNNQRSRNVKLNCDKIKNKIVDQLFMMDKDKIHKLMDNPNSSSKFEFAINSLVTESQNSLNRHLRSVAEKSLCSSSSTEFIHHDNNTIYEDTFMKQMQCILDPQDTVLLEDIKPMVLAELSKVLQLDNIEQSCEVDETTYRADEPYHKYPSYDYENYEPYSAGEDQDNYYEQKPQTDYEQPDSPCYGNKNNIDCSTRLQEFDSTNLFERRSGRKSKDYDESRRISSEIRSKERRNIECNLDDNLRRSVTTPPLFDTNPNQLSEEEDDPFAELDKQYHVAVDHNFIENDDISSPQPVKSNSPLIKSELTPEKPYSVTPPGRIYVKVPDDSPEKLKEEIDHQLQDMAKSPLKFSPLNINSKYELECISNSLESKVKQESHYFNNSNKTPEKQMDVDNRETENLSAEHIPEPKAVEVTEKSESSSCTVKSSTPCQSRKRSIDQRPSHRKEKRKKSESTQSDNLSTNKQILNKNIIINVNDCPATKSEKCDTTKSIFNLYFSKEKNSKEPPKDTVKKVDTVDKGYSDKYVKRKDERKKSRDKDSDVKKKHDSSSSSHSMLSPDLSKSQTPTKGDGQTKLKPIDMFVEQPRKPSAHQAHRNSAPLPTVHNKVTVETKPLVLSRKLTKRHVATQVARKCVSRESQTMSSKCSISRHSQTERKKLFTRGAQTESISFNPKIKATDAFERMKEIDMEIQALLQEKFKLYNSLESKESGPRTMQSLGMTVLNVTPIDDTHADNDSPSGDTIVDEFTNIPVEELEQIALETVEEEIHEIEQCEKKSRRQKILAEERKRSISPATSTTSTRSKKNTKAPNISLIEQIITDDRPLEDIIALDDFEVSPVKTRNKSLKSKGKPKKKTTKKRKVSKSCEIVKELVEYDLKECSVALIREDFSKYYPILETELQFSTGEVLPEPETAATNESQTPEASQNVVEEPVNDIQFDMLDVSEDIVIGDVCEVKCSEDKELGYAGNPSICEEIILDNSQSSMEEATADHGCGNECKMYDYSVDENLRRDCVTVSGHADAVLAIECIENNFVAACLDGNVYHFSGDGQLLSTLRGSNLAVTCLTIVKEKYGTTVYTGSLDSRIRYYDLETGLEKGPECNVLSPIQTMDRAWETVFVGTRTGFVLQFECKNNMLIPVSTVKFSEQSILALRAMKEGPRKVLLVAARSEPVTIKDAQTGLLLRTLEGPKMTVYTLLFEDGKVYCGTSSHLIHVFDYSSGSHVGSHEGGKGAVCLRATGGLLFAGCYDGCVYVYREGDSRPLAQLRGPSLMLLSLAVVGSKIIAGYKDRSLYIWKIPLSILQEMIL